MILHMNELLLVVINQTVFKKDQMRFVRNDKTEAMKGPTLVTLGAFW